MHLERIFFIRSDRLGEFILSLPAIKLIKENYPTSKIFLLAKKDNINLVKRSGFIDYFFEYKEDFFKGLKGSFRLANILKKEKIDCVISLNPKKEFHFASFLGGVSIRVGYDRKWGFCLNKKISDKKYLENKHEIEYNIDLVQLICKRVFIPQVELPIDKKESLNFLKKEIDLEKDYIVLYPFTSSIFKKIERSFWINLINHIRREIRKDIVLIGHEEEVGESRILEEKSNVINPVGSLSIKNLAAF